MRIFDANISQIVFELLLCKIRNVYDFEIVNQEIYDSFGILNFIESNEALDSLRDSLLQVNNVVEDTDRTEYGDFQTNFELAKKVIQHVSNSISPNILIEPTCGKGSFIITALKSFSSIETIYGIEIFKPYVWETKFNIINHLLENPKDYRVDINIYHCSVFDFDFKKIASKNSNKELLVVGNPPWVTNSKLGSLNSLNLPPKANFKNHNGLDAITGKSNFDIAEYITITLIETFQHMKGHLLFLVKNSVIKNIVFDQKKNFFRISSIEKYCIDSKKEFNVSVEASLLFCKFNSISSYKCDEYNLYDSQRSYIKFGWFDDKFVSNLDTYIHTKSIDGTCQFVWRQGIKHDCSSIMELEKSTGSYINGLGEKVELENDLIYGILKSSDLKNIVINSTRKHTIVTQKKVGEETNYIKVYYPKTHQYLESHKSYFDARKSSIYTNKPSYSIFGIGDYSFKEFKVAISGLYKTFHFTLILPQNNKTVMLDDTCYFIGFEKIEYAVYSLILLNSNTALRFLKSITFSDAKRTFTKDVLMRLDFLELSKELSEFEISTELELLNKKYNFNVGLEMWDSYIHDLHPAFDKQLALFE